MISSVYTYYLSQYGNNINARYDSHSKKELKNSFSKVAKINSHAPTYKTDISEDAQRYAIDLKENARRLGYIANDLSDNNEGGMNYKKSASSSNSDQVEAEYIGDSTTPDSQSFDIEVKQIATNQINTGNYLQPNSKILKPGQYAFDLNINNLTYAFEFDIDSSETTSDVQNKISRLINRSNIGINSEISTDSLGNQALTITSDSTGIYGANPTIFSIHSDQDAQSNNDNYQNDDVSDDSSKNRNDIISTLGLDRVSQHPVNAIFSINGDERFSQNNSITINKMFLLNMKAPTTDEPVKISLTNDSDSIVQSIGDLVTGYNKLFSVATDDKNDQFEGSQKLKKEFRHIIHSYSDQLEKSGLEIDDDGEINVDTDKLKSVAEAGTINDVFTSLSSFKKAIQHKAEYIAIDPMNYVNNKIIAYKNPRRITIDPYNLSAYTGMMFNGYI